MKKISFFIILTVIVFMYTPSYAWKFIFENNIPLDSRSLIQKITCDVYGEHFFWRDKVDCTVTAGKDQEDSCDAGPGICPVALACRATDPSGVVTYMDWTYIGVKCWDVTMRVYVRGPGIAMYLDGCSFTSNWHK